MKTKMITRMLLMGLAAVGLLYGQASAVEFNLVAGTTTVNLPGIGDVTMWGFGLEGGPITVPGPALTVPPGESLRINLTNNLPGDNPVSLMILGQAMPTDGESASPQVVRNPDGRIRSFVHETANGESGVYEWANIKPGTYLYQSATHPAVQVQMGLYGGLINNAGENEAYAGVTYDDSTLLIYSEIDPALHAAVENETYGTEAYPSTIDYAPKYFLINGVPYTEGLDNFRTFEVGEKVLVRFVNAGLQTHMPVLMGMDLSLVAEDGNLYPYSKIQYSVPLPAGKTVDALVTPAVAGQFPIVDRALSLTNGGSQPGGMLTYLKVDPAD